MKKRLVSMFLALAMCMGLAVPAVAAEPDDSVQLVQLCGETVEMRFYQTDGIPYISIDGEEFYRIGDEVFTGNKKLATIVSDEADGIMPLTGWIYQNNCPYGTRYEYTKHVASADKVHNIKFEEAIAYYSAKTILACISLSLQAMLPGIAGDLASDFVDDINEELKIDPFFGDATALYAKERVMAHETLGSIYRMNIFSCIKIRTCQNL